MVRELHHRTQRRRYNRSMQHATAQRLPSADELTALSTAQLAALVHTQAQTIEALQHQLTWFKRQLFGAKSERFIGLPDARQLNLGELIGSSSAAPEQRKVVAAHTRRTVPRDPLAETESTPF